MSPNPVKLLQPRRVTDERGWLSETYRESALRELGIDVRFVQDNHSLSRPVHTIRGLHFQIPPHALDKLVRCVRGRVFDVAVDLRKGSPTYGRWVGEELSAEDGRQLYIPVGFAHGFCTLEPDSEVVYKMSDYYTPDCDRGLRWDDPEIGVRWPPVVSPSLSERDRKLPLLSEFDSPFVYEGQPLLPLTCENGLSRHG